MQPKARKIVNTLIIKKEKKKIQIEKDRVKDEQRYRKIDGRPPSFLKRDIAVDVSLYHFIVHEKEPNFMLIVWESLEIDYTDINRRYSRFYDAFIYKANNIAVLKKLQSENRMVAVSGAFLEEMKEAFKASEFKVLKGRLQVSTFLMLYRKFIPKYMKGTEKVDECITNIKLKEILEDLINGRHAKEKVYKLGQYDVDLYFVIQKLLEVIDDGAFSKHILEKMEILQDT